MSGAGPAGAQIQCESLVARGQPLGPSLAATTSDAGRIATAFIVSARVMA
jgi:hypothetical protein